MRFLLLDAALAALPLLAFLGLRSVVARRSGGRTANLTVRAFLAGLFAVIPAAAIELSLLPPAEPIAAFTVTRVLGTAGRAFLAVALIEETAKLCALVLVSGRPKREPADGSGSASGAGQGRTELVPAGISTGLGFALLENMFYNFGDTGTLLFRGLFAVPLHACAGGFLGITVRGAGSRFRPAGFLAAVLLHGLYDTLLGLPSPAPFFAPVTAACAAILLYGAHARAVRAGKRAD
jgi:RsiW-degrading membrane proteinase PrsW (M82 family)